MFNSQILYRINSVRKRWGSRGQRSPALVGHPASHMLSVWSSANTSWEITTDYFCAAFILQPNIKANIPNPYINTITYQFIFSSVPGPEMSRTHCKAEQQRL